MTNEMLFLTLLFCLCHRIGTLIVDITIQPENLLLKPHALGGHVTVTCSADTEGPEEIVHKMYLKRTGPGDTKQISLAILTIASRNIILNSSLLGLTATGNLTAKILVVTLENAKCQDVGEYHCYGQSSHIGRDVASQNTSSDTFNVEVTPGDLTLVHEPKLQKTMWLGETLKMMCTGPVGTVIPSVTQIDWVWEYRNISKFADSQWMTCDNDASNIQTGNPFKAPCYELHSSTLKRVLTMNDTDREYRCYIYRNGQSFVEYAATFSVGTVLERAIDDSSPFDMSALFRRGVVIGVVTGLACVTGVVVIMRIIRHQQSVQEERRKNDPGYTHSTSTAHKQADGTMASQGECSTTRSGELNNELHEVSRSQSLSSTDSDMPTVVSMPSSELTASGEQDTLQPNTPTSVFRLSAEQLKHLKLLNKTEDSSTPTPVFRLSAEQLEHLKLLNKAEESSGITPVIE